jgi:N-acetylglucosaminyl-diphospho-decaprenol L-rhamnosyltransferase
MQKTLLISIVIVNYRTPKLIIDCLETLLPAIELLDAKVVIVDNYSQDNSLLLIADWLSSNDNDNKVTLIDAPHNNGFSSGNNIGIKKFDSEYYLLLNSDTLVRKNAINELIKIMQSNENCGIVSPRLEWKNGVGQESCFNLHTPISEFLNAASTGFVDRLFNRFIVAMPVQQKLTKTSWTSFACVLIRKEVFDKIGLLDDGYFMYFEDVEFCHRTTKAGWSILHTPAAKIVHLRGGSSDLKDKQTDNRKLPIYYYESRARYFYQTQGLLSLIAANALWSLGRSISFTRQICGRKDKITNQNKLLDNWKNCLKPLALYTHPKTAEKNDK